jgi:hypothetical protein
MVSIWVTLVSMFVSLAIGYVAGHDAGQNSVKQIDKACPEQKEKLISSSHSNAGTICVYQESWKTRGKVKRIEL